MQSNELACPTKSGVQNEGGVFTGVSALHIRCKFRDKHAKYELCTSPCLPPTVLRGGVALWVSLSVLCGAKVHARSGKRIRSECAYAKSQLWPGLCFFFYAYKIIFYVILRDDLHDFSTINSLNFNWRVRFNLNNVEDCLRFILHWVSKFLSTII